MKQIYVVGIGPGKEEGMTAEARDVISSCEVIVGYQKYMELIRALCKGKEIIVTGMRQEKERCEKALLTAQEGRTTAMVCSGDAGVYGMAGLLYEMGEAYPGVEIRVIPGVTAALSGAAVLGAPLSHDFALISLSDLLTPYELIEKRLALAAQADFVICLYNPSSHNRPDYLKKACEILLRYKRGETVCGYVRNIGREGEEAEILSLLQLMEAQVDMFTTVFIGNSTTRRIGDKMVTKRGYRIENQEGNRV